MRKINLHSKKIATPLVKFLDKHNFTADELLDSEFIAEIIQNFPDYFAGVESITDIHAMELATKYIALKPRSHAVV